MDRRISVIKTSTLLITLVAVTIVYPTCSLKSERRIHIPAKRFNANPVKKARSPQLDRLRFPLKNPKTELKVPILMYHRVGEILPGSGSVAKDLTLRVGDFVDQMRYLKSTGFNTITLSELFKCLYFGKKLPKKPIVITFDDGYKDLHWNAFRILRRFDFRGVFFVITDVVGSRQRLGWSDIEEMDHLGMEIGSHTLSHADLKAASPSEAWREIYSSKITLEKKLKHPIYSFCYPFGRYSEVDPALLKKAGYLLATTTHYGKRVSSDLPFSIPRIRIHRSTTLEEFKAMIE